MKRIPKSDQRPALRAGLVPDRASGLTNTWIYSVPRSRTDNAV